MKQQEGLGNAKPGRETSLGWEGRLCRESKLGRETRLGRETSLGFEGRLYRKSRRDRDSKLYRDISLGWEVGPSMESRLGRESRLSRETSLWWEGRLCRESWLGIAYSNRCIYHFNPTSSPNSSWLLFFICFCKRLPQLVLCSAV